MLSLGIIRPGSTIYIPFGSYAGSTGAPSATTGFTAADIQIYKDGGTTQRASSSGITVTADFDTLTGINLISVDLSDNTTADFYAAGARYIVVVSDVTIDGQTMRFPIARFVIGMETSILDTTIASLASQTSFTLTVGSADNNTYIGCPVYIHDAASAVQCAMGVVSAYTGSTKTVTLAFDPAIFTVAAKDNISIYPRMNAHAFGGTVQTARDIGASVLLSSGTGTGQIDFTSGVVKANVTQLLGTAWLTPGTAGTPDVNVKLISGGATAADNAEAFFDGTGYAGTNNVIPTVTTLTGHTAQTGDSYAIVNSGTHGNAALKTLIDAVDNFVDTEIADIQARLPAALSGGNMKVDILAVNGDTTAAANLAKTTRAIGRGTVGGSPSTTSIPTSAFTPNGAATDQFKGRIITFDANTSTAALQGQSTDITASSNAAAPTFTVTALTTAPAVGDTFSVT